MEYKIFNLLNDEEVNIMIPGCNRSVFITVYYHFSLFLKLAVRYQLKTVESYFFFKLLTNAEVNITVPDHKICELLFCFSLFLINTV